MAKEAVKQVITKMLSDEDFRNELLVDAEATIRAGGYDVTEKELEAFKQLQEADLADLSPEELEERLSKGTTVLTPIFFVSHEKQAAG